MNRIDEICATWSHGEILKIIDNLGRFPRYFFREGMYPELSDLWSDLHTSLDLKVKWKG